MKIGIPRKTRSKNVTLVKRHPNSAKPNASEHQQSDIGDPVEHFLFAVLARVERLNPVLQVEQRVFHGNLLLEKYPLPVRWNP